MNKLVTPESILNKLDDYRSYTKSDIENILNSLPSDYDTNVATARIRHFSSLVPQLTLEQIIEAISDTSTKSFYD